MARRSVVVGLKTDRTFVQRAVDPVFVDEHLRLHQRLCGATFVWLAPNGFKSAVFSFSVLTGLMTLLPYSAQQVRSGD